MKTMNIQQDSFSKFKIFLKKKIKWNEYIYKCDKKKNSGKWKLSGINIKIAKQKNFLSFYFYFYFYSIGMKIL